MLFIIQVSYFFTPFTAKEDIIQQESLVMIQDNFMFYLVIILFGLSWMLLITIMNFISNIIYDNKYTGTILVKLMLIIVLIMVVIIAFPILKLSYTSGEYIELDNILFIEDSDSAEYLDSAEYIELDNILFIEDSSSDESSDSAEDEAVWSRPGSEAGEFGGAGEDGGNNGGDGEGDDEGTGRGDRHSNSGSESHICSHGVEGHCDLCIEDSHKASIARCTHYWVQFDHENDPRVMDAPCDMLDSTGIQHRLCGDSTNIIYHCSSCNAMACQFCIVDSGPPSPDSEGG